MEACSQASARKGGRAASFRVSAGMYDMYLTYQQPQAKEKQHRFESGNVQFRKHNRAHNSLRFASPEPTGRRRAV
mgnify:CR=1 FL=1